MSHPVPVSSGCFVPQALLLDKRLTPLERNAWMAMRALADTDGGVVITYDELSRYLACVQGAAKAAAETVARALRCLRETGWVSLVEYCRDSAKGCVTASRYVVRDESIALIDNVGDVVPDISGSQWTMPGDPKQGEESGPTVQVQNQYVKEVQVQGTVSKEKPCAVRPATMSAAVRFDLLPAEHRPRLVSRLAELVPQQRAEVLAEWSARCAAGLVRNAVAYLYGLIRRAVEGAFKLWAGKGAEPVKALVSPPSSAEMAKPPMASARAIPVAATPIATATAVRAKADPQHVRECLAKMRASLESATARADDAALRRGWRRVLG
ncbi:MAG: helix-turn-helix domain-containing protein [Chromatiales bacterium]|jgi:hypothetical protein|nr:helix-turn-helix domain-containing protein [Chromatiales bacterium]